MSGRSGDLTCLANVKAWRSPPVATNADDGQIGRAITAASRYLLGAMQRTLAPKTCFERRSGNGQASLMLRNGPILSVTSVHVAGCEIPAAGGVDRCGYVWSPGCDPFDPESQMLYLRGFSFERGVQNIEVAYSAGLQIDGEPHTVPESAPYQIAALSLGELLSCAVSVAYADGGILVPVDGTPTGAGHYQPPLGPDGVYTFSDADAGASVAITYGYTPRDIEEACILTVIHEYNHRDRIGTNAKSLAGENVTYYTGAAMLPAVEDRIRRYRNVVPIG